MMPHIVAGHHATTLLHSGIMPLYSGLHCGRTPCHPASHSQWHHGGHHAAIIHPSCTQEDHATNATVGKKKVAGILKAHNDCNHQEDHVNILVDRSKEDFCI